MAQAMNGGSLDFIVSSSQRPSSLVAPNSSSNHVAQPTLAQPTSTRLASFSGSTANATSAATATPMLFGASSSMWGPTSKGNSPAPLGGRRGKRARQVQVQPSQAYSLSQSQIGLNHQLWGSPHDMFGGQGGGGGGGEQQRIALQQQQTPSPPLASEYYDPTESTLSSQQTYTGAPHLVTMPGVPPQFNPAVGSPARPGARAEQLYTEPYRQQGRHGPPPPLPSTSLNLYPLGPDAAGAVFSVDPDQRYAQQDPQLLQQGMNAGIWTPGSNTWS